MTHKPREAPAHPAAGLPVIDCDLHHEVPRRNALLNYLPDRWIAYLRDSGFTGPDADD